MSEPRKINELNKDLVGHSDSLEELQTKLGVPQPTSQPKQGESQDAALKQFTEYFVRNYPGPDSIIHNPYWHAPKIFRAAEAALAARPQEQASQPPEAQDERIWCMTCGKSVSSPVPKDTVVRAYVECPECIEKRHASGEPEPQDWRDMERDNALELAATVADKHWPESGHVHQDGAVSCQMSISIEIRRLKGQKNRSALDLMLQEAFQRGQQAMSEKAGQLREALEAVMQHVYCENDYTSRDYEKYYAAVDKAKAALAGAVKPPQEKP